jgi:hypothetical protein
MAVLSRWFSWAWKSLITMKDCLNLCRLQIRLWNEICLQRFLKGFNISSKNAHQNRAEEAL